MVFRSSATSTKDSKLSTQISSRLDVPSMFRSRSPRNEERFEPAQILDLVRKPLDVVVQDLQPGWHTLIAIPCAAVLSPTRSSLEKGRRTGIFPRGDQACARARKRNPSRTSAWSSGTCACSRSSALDTVHPEPTPRRRTSIPATGQVSSATSDWPLRPRAPHMVSRHHDHR